MLLINITEILIHYYLSIHHEVNGLSEGPYTQTLKLLGQGRVFI